MDDLDGPLVRKWEQWYSSRPDYIDRIVERSHRVLFHVVEEVERRGMPAEIALLPIVESAYNPRAYSRSHAAGMWQFIPSTGRIYGLQQNWWYDGRRDIVAATRAALDYLQKLHGQFENWELALASYNCGEGMVSRAVARNGARGLPTEYASLTLPNETRNYLPKLQAVKNIVSDPARFGLTLTDIPNEPYFTVLTVPHHIDIGLAARLAGIPVEEFRLLNPAHIRPVINANSAETIVLPRDKAEVFLRNLESHTRPMVSWQAYRVKRGDTLWRIGIRNGVSVAELRRINNLSPRAKLRIGQPLVIPLKRRAKPNMPDLPVPRVMTNRTKGVRHVPRSRRGRSAKKAEYRRAVHKRPTKERRTRVE